MENDLNNQLAALMAGTLPEDQRKGLLEKVLSDRDLAGVANILGLPELDPDNNLPVPFEIGASFLGGWHQAYILAVDASNLSFGKRSRNLLDHLSRIVGVKSLRCFRKSLDIAYEIPAGVGALNLTLERSDNSSLLRISHQGKEPLLGDIEIWEKGNLVLRTPCEGISERPGYTVKPGVALAIRYSASEEGLSILLSEFEFSASDWKSACLVSCLEGDLVESVRILRKEIRPNLDKPDQIERISSLISGFGTVTRTDGFSLAPAPATRSPVIEREVKLAAFEPVWRGIARCWPSASKVRSPWCESDPATPQTTDLPGDLPNDVAVLIHACSKAVEEKLLPDLPPDSEKTSTDPAAQNGWAAFVGWNHLLQREYEQAQEAFSSVPPIQEDPFCLGIGVELADHLTRAENEEVSETDLAASSDRAWKNLLSQVL